MVVSGEGFNGATYAPLSGSKLVDAGFALGQLIDSPSDYDEASANRVRGQGMVIGAYEFQSAGFASHITADAYRGFAGATGFAFAATAENAAGEVAYT